MTCLLAYTIINKNINNFSILSFLYPNQITTTKSGLNNFLKNMYNIFFILNSILIKNRSDKTQLFTNKKQIPCMVTIVVYFNTTSLPTKNMSVWHMSPVWITINVNKMWHNGTIFLGHFLGTSLFSHVFSLWWIDWYWFESGMGVLQSFRIEVRKKCMSNIARPRCIVRRDIFD